MRSRLWGILLLLGASADLEELFRKAALWEVGTNRRIVREAREALKARGEEAVRFLVQQKLGVRTTLEWRALAEVILVWPGVCARWLGKRLREGLEGEALRNALRLCARLRKPPCAAALKEYWTQIPERRDVLIAFLEAARVFRPAGLRSRLAPLRDHPDPRIRALVLAVEADLSGDGELLWKALADGDPVRRYAAERYLAAWEGLKAWWENYCRSPSPACARLARNLEEPPARLLEWLQKAEPRVQAWSAWALRKWCERRDIAVRLLEAAQSEAPFLRGMALCGSS